MFSVDPPATACDPVMGIDPENVSCSMIGVDDAMSGAAYVTDWATCCFVILKPWSVKLSALRIR